MNTYFQIAFAVLLLMFVDQACAMRRMADFIELQDHIIDDYWGYMRSCDKEKK